jgi:hypothetical protein
MSLLKRLLIIFCAYVLSLVLISLLFRSHFVFNPRGIVDVPYFQINVPAILQKIAFCESGNRQFQVNNSELPPVVLRGKQNPLDVGRFQINEFYHLKTAKKLGMDIYTWEGNTQYALYLYSKNGTRDWNWSKSCWGQLL